jgi:hypothetical protein
LWLGEFGPHNGGGGGTYASTFVSSLWYLDALGTLAELNHSVLARQTLVGGNYVSDSPWSSRIALVDRDHN